MISSFAQTIIAILLIPCIPLLIYLIGILIPESHIVSRTTTYKTRPERLWQLLTNVQQYPSWRPKLDKVSIDSITEATLDEGKRVVFVEHSKRHRRTVILHVEQQPMKTMLRVLEERITTAVSLRSPVPTRPHVPTFSGSWTFELKYPDQKHFANNSTKTTPQAVQLKITEQGVIKKPLVRLSNMLLFGYHRRIDRFMKDLEKRIELDQVIDHDTNSDNDNITTLHDDITTTTGDNNGEGFDKKDRSQQKSADDDENSCIATTDHDLVTHSLLNNDLLNMNLDTSNIYHKDKDDSAAEERQQQESRILEKDWDLVSEIYERQKE
ncbi:hypothetical protein BC941DRAFT_434482 [Chlamydoabsidia padenii]|nr:hypothetical protein BC941DRAFT_434482 [Chlamydoabsidia padenii]